MHGEKGFAVGGLTCGPLGDFRMSPHGAGIASHSDVFWERPRVAGADPDIFFHISGIIISKNDFVSWKKNA